MSCAHREVEDEKISFSSLFFTNQNQSYFMILIIVNILFFSNPESFILSEYHNAPQLSAWCLHFMCTNYNALCRSQGHREMRNVLDKKTLDYLEENRWPPVWYLKEQDYYERTVRNLATEQHKKREEKKRRRMCSGCFWLVSYFPIMSFDWSVLPSSVLTGYFQSLQWFDW